MFKNQENLLGNYYNYLSTLKCQMNASSMDDSLDNDETLIMNVYHGLLNYRYICRHSKTLDKVILLNGGIDDTKKAIDYDIEDIIDGKKEFSFVDTINNIKNNVMFSGTAYIFTDYGMIKIQGNNINHHAALNQQPIKIFKITVYLNSTEHVNDIEDFLNSVLIEAPIMTKKKNLTICVNGSYGIRTERLAFDDFECNLERNYNDDLPYDEINELINSDSKELILLHGEPGTGKTSIIKKLINDNPQIEFVYFDFNLLASISDSKVFDFLSEHKSQVFVIEDCEKLFTERNSGNIFLNTMLNLTDGIIGESFKIKFICTFNCNKNKIDNAVLRKGRLSLIYEFKKLTLEKTRMHKPNASIPMTIADIYNENDNGHNNITRVGF